MISDEINKEEELSPKRMRDVVVSKLLFDQSIVIDKCMADNFNDKVLSSLYNALSLKSRTILSNGYENQTNEFHRLIGFDKDSIKPDTPITNGIILNLCNGFICLDDCKHKF
jgi:hypothetical protein